MDQFLVLVVLDFVKITSPILALIFIFFLFLAGFYLNFVDLNDCGGAYLLALVPIIGAVFPPLIFAGFFWSFRLMLRNLVFLRPGLKFLDVEIVLRHASNIELHVCKTTTLDIVLISLTGVEAGPKIGFFFFIDRFFNDFIEVIKFLAALLHFYPH